MDEVLQNAFVSVELFKDAHTTQLVQQAIAAVTLEYLTVIAGKANKPFKLLKTKQTKRMRLEQLAY